MKIRPDGTVRFNGYIKADLNERMETYCKDNFLSKNGFVNMVLKQYFDGLDALKSMGNITDLMRLVSEKAGVDLSQLPAGSDQKSS